MMTRYNILRSFERDRVDQNVAARLEVSTESQLRAVAQDICRRVVEKNELDESYIIESLRAIPIGPYGDSPIRQKIQVAFEQLERKSWELSSLLDDDLIDESTYTKAFQRTRAVNALYSALDVDPFTAATTAIYEASYGGLDKAEISNIVEPHLRQSE